MKDEVELFLLPAAASTRQTLARRYSRAFAEARELFVVPEFLAEWNRIR
jgi:hypothetical protein